MKNILAAIMLMGATVSVDAMAPNAMQLNTTWLRTINTARQQFIAATQQAKNSLLADNKRAFNPCIQARDAMLTHLGTLCDMFNQYIRGRFVRVQDILNASQAYDRAQIAWTQALHTWQNIQQSKAERVWSALITQKTKEQHAETIAKTIKTIETLIQPSLLEAIFTSIGDSIGANPIYRELQNLPKANIPGSEGQCSNILNIQAAINEKRAEINQLENDLLTRLSQHVAGATLQDLELALDQNHQNLTITQQAIRNLPRQIRDPLTRQFNDFRRRRRTVPGQINRQKGIARICIADLHRIPTQNDALRDQVCARLTQLVNAL